MDRNSQKWSRKCCHSLPFAATVSDRCSFEQFHNLNKRQGSFPHHSIPPCNLYKWKGFLTACRNTAAYCIIFLTVWNSWLRQQISKMPSLYKESLSFCSNDEGKQPVKTKAECFKAWRLFLLSSLFHSNMHYWPSVRSIWLDIWPNSFFCILLDFLKVLKVLYFFPGWLCHETSSLARSLRDLMHWSSSSLTVKNLLSGRLVPSLAFCLPRRSRVNKKKNDANIQLSWPKKLGQ